MQEHTQEKIGFVFINGAGLESRIWSKVVEGLDHPCLLVEFPLRKSSVDSRSELSLEDYVVHMKKQVDEWRTQRFVIVAHSLGGVLALRLASELNHRLAGFIAVGAAIPKNGGSFVSALPFPKRILMSAILRKLGTKPPESAIRTGLCNDLSEDQTMEVVKGFIPEAVRIYTDRIDVSIPFVPKLYVKLTKDKEFGPSLQRKMISNLSPQSVQSLETGHLPMISNPEGLKHVLLTFLNSLRNTTINTRGVGMYKHACD
ncbi:alpha/beta fold hydrolase [Cohnella sp. CFH 77786]|nr:alpha/beta fold hydrolase [Cohnella sp. CFH 77786]